MSCLEGHVLWTSRAQLIGRRRVVVGAALWVAACGGGEGAGPPPPRFDRVQLVLPAYSSLLPTPPDEPILWADSMPVPSDFVAALSIRGFLLTDAGTVDTTSGMTINWSVESGGGSLGVASTTAQAGQVENQWFLGPLTPGTPQGIVLTSPNVPTYAQHMRIRVYQGPMRIEHSPAEITGMVGTAVAAPLTVRLLDANGTPLPRVLVRFGSNGTITYLGDTVSARRLICLYPPGCQDESFIYTYTDGNGAAAINLTLPTTTDAGAGAVPEAPKRTETSGIPNNGNYVSRIVGTGWTITATPGPTAQITIVSGDNQAGSPGGTLGVPLVVRVADQYGNARTAEAVTWVPVSGGGSVASAATTTDGTGQSSNTWTLGPSSGMQTVSATAGTVTITFSATAGP